MIKTVNCILFFCFIIDISSAYTYVVDTWQHIPDLSGTESILVTGQGGSVELNAADSSWVTVEATSLYNWINYGGIWVIDLFDSSHLDFSGGQAGAINLHLNATARFSGGMICGILSNQASKLQTEPGVWIPNPHITVVYSGDIPTVDSSNVLAGFWGNGDSFSIQLADGLASSAYSNIHFELIPEPTTLMLFGAGLCFPLRSKHKKSLF